MKKVYAINGSPRRNRNTATLLDKVLEGCRDAFPGMVETERINLGDLHYTGCKSCFACKLKDGPSYGTCALRDDIRPVLEQIRTANAVVFGSPIYYNTITSLLHAFYERLFFPYLTYKKGFPTLVTNRMKTACVYTMNVTERDMLERGYRDNLRSFERYLELYFSKPGLLYAFNTCQFDDYSKYVCGAFSGEEKMAYRTEFFPKDCEAAYALGLNLLK